MNKVKILTRTAKKTVKKVLSGNLTYRGNNPLKLAGKAAKYAKRNGYKAFVNRTKQEIVSIDKRLGSNLAFPNGLVTGVDPLAIARWFTEDKKPVTIIIPSYNDFEFLKPCIDSIKTTTADFQHLIKVIIIDDYCQEDNRKNLQSLEDEQIQVIYREENGGFAKAVNTGLNAADSRYDVVLMNSDIVAHNGWLEALQYGAYEFGVDTGIVGPKLLYPDGRIQSAGSHRNTEVPTFFDHYYRFQDSNYGPANIPQYCLGVTGACMYIKREFLTYVGILDENFQFAFEDMDWCLRGWEAGFRSLYFPAATLTHVESASRPKHKTLSEREKQSVSYFWEKWGDWFDGRNVKNAEGKIRVIFVLQSIQFSGGIKNVFEQANRLAERNFDVEIWSLDKQPSAWEVSDKLRLRSFKNYERLITALTPVEAIKIATWWETSFPVWLSSVQKGIAVNFVQEFETWFYPDDIISQSSVIACYRKEFRNLTISSYNMTELNNIGLTATLLPCGYEEALYKPLAKIERKDDVLLGVGRKFFQKNFEMTFKGWKLLGNNRPNLWLYGFETQLEKLDPKITYFNKPSNEGVNELYNQATVFVQTSRHEGFCLPILEAMAAGCPVVCTDAHGNRDFCFKDKNCLMVEQDDAEGLKDALDRLFNDPKLRARLSAEALKTVRSFRWPVIIDKAEIFYKELAK